MQRPSDYGTDSPYFTSPGDAPGPSRLVSFATTSTPLIGFVSTSRPRPEVSSRRRYSHFRRWTVNWSVPRSRQKVAFLSSCLCRSPGTCKGQVGLSLSVRFVESPLRIPEETTSRAHVQISEKARTSRGFREASPMVWRSTSVLRPSAPICPGQ